MRAVSGLACVLGLTACVGGGGQPSAGSAGSGDDGGVSYTADRGGAGAEAAAGSRAEAGGSVAAGSSGVAAPAANSGGSGGAASAGTSAAVGGASGSATSAAGSGGQPAPTAATSGARDSHFPLLAGAQWTYHHSGGTKAAWDEVDTMQATTYLGKPAFLLEDQEDVQGAQTHSTLVVQGTGIYRAAKEVTVAGQTALTVKYDPAFLRYDEGWMTVQQKVTLDDSWVQTCVFSSIVKTCAPGAVKTGTTSHEYTVLGVNVPVTVPAGSFETVQIRRVDPNTSETKLYWFAKGVGKVRDEAPATGEVAELTAYKLP